MMDLGSWAEGCLASLEEGWYARYRARVETERETAKKAALDDYWAAQTPAQERAAAARLAELGLA